MDRKVFLSIFLVIILISLLDGCSHHKNDPDKTIDQTKIKSQVSKWAQASETGDTNNIKQSMIAENILVVFKGDGVSEERVFETVDNFIDFFAKGIWTYQSSVMEVNNISFSNNLAKVYGKWSRIDDYKKYISLMEFDLEKINDNWFISVLHFGKDSEEYMGNEYEDFLEGKHSAYLSFVAGEKKYVFHDNYGGTSVTTAYNSDSLIINAYNELTGNGFKKEFDTGSSAVKSSSLSLDENRYHSDSINLTDLDMSFADGLVTGRFSGTFAGTEDIKVKDGFFYVKHEFNIPEITINSPRPGFPVSGEVIISGTVKDDSDIYFIDVQVHNNLSIVFWEEMYGTDNWSFTFDSTEYNGSCSLLVDAQDIYGNKNSKEINFTINNN